MIMVMGKIKVLVRVVGIGVALVVIAIVTVTGKITTKITKVNVTVAMTARKEATVIVIGQMAEVIARTISITKYQK